MFIHDVIKIRYVNMGYLPGYPYDLISDKEMFDAFLREDGFFNDFYPCPASDLQSDYDALKEYIVNSINKYLEDGTTIPDWVYSYMIMRPITFDSDEPDIAYLCELANIESPKAESEFTDEVARMCLNVSKKWIQKLPAKNSDRPPTMFGETHVTKSLRLDQANILTD